MSADVLIADTRPYIEASAMAAKALGDYRGANLERAHLMNANLRGADLPGAAYLRDADLQRADLQGHIQGEFIRY